MRKQTRKRGKGGARDDEQQVGEPGLQSRSEPRQYGYSVRSKTIRVPPSWLIAEYFALGLPQLVQNLDGARG
jgi:hypothetical protein